ncbi:MAG: hypothetical protein ACTS6H_01595 [Candidatus Hodgkinia cicadicola]
MTSFAFKGRFAPLRLARSAELIELSKPIARRLKHQPASGLSTNLPRSIERSVSLNFGRLQILQNAEVSTSLRSTCRRLFA